MEWKDRIARLFRRKPEWEREHRRTLIARHAENLLRERDISSIADLVRRHRKSNLTIAGIGLTMNTATSRFLRTPEDAAGKDMLELMDALRRTPFAKKIGRRLADVPGRHRPLPARPAGHAHLSLGCLSGAASRQQAPAAADGRGAGSSAYYRPAVPHRDVP